MKTPEQVLPLPDVYYDSNRMSYRIKNDRSGWTSVNESSVKRHLKAEGYGSTPAALDQAIVDIQRKNDVSYTGALAGYWAGLQEFGDVRILVTSSPTLIVPKKRDWRIIRSLLERMFFSRENKQLLHFYGWLKIAFQALQSKKYRPGQALAIAGPRDCGKSFIQNYIITPILGGRIGKPFQYMIGDTPFNSDLFDGEHLMIEDEAASTDNRARQKLSARLKEITVNQLHRLHQKKYPAISGIQPFWRCSITLNDEPESLLVLPPINEGIEDKIILLKSNKGEMPMPTITPDERHQFVQRILDELPGFLHFLQEWEIPKELVCHRFGIKPFHHPEIRGAIDSLSPEQRLLTVIDGIFFPAKIASPFAKREEFIEMRAAELERRMIGDTCYGFEAKRLLYYNSACGTYLRRLLRKHSHRISVRRVNGHKLWKITPP
jgi:hypothetical protein